MLLNPVGRELVELRDGKSADHLQRGESQHLYSSIALFKAQFIVIREFNERAHFLGVLLLLLGAKHVQLGEGQNREEVEALVVLLHHQHVLVRQRQMNVVDEAELLLSLRREILEVEYLQNLFFREQHKTAVLGEAHDIHGPTDPACVVVGLQLGRLAIH